MTDLEYAGKALIAASDAYDACVHAPTYDKEACNIARSAFLEAQERFRALLAQEDAPTTLSFTPFGDARYRELGFLGEPRNKWEHEMMKVANFQLAKALEAENTGESWQLYGAQHAYAYIDGLIYAIQRNRELGT